MHTLVLAKDVFAVNVIAIDDGELRISGPPLMVKDSHVPYRFLEVRQLVDLFASGFAGPTADTQRGVVQQAIPLIRNLEIGVLGVSFGIRRPGSQCTGSDPSEETPA